MYSHTQLSTGTQGSALESELKCEGLAISPPSIYTLIAKETDRKILDKIQRNHLAGKYCWIWMLN